MERADEGLLVCNTPDPSVKGWNSQRHEQGERSYQENKAMNKGRK
jgi:hypothetical protein